MSNVIKIVTVYDKRHDYSNIKTIIQEDTRFTLSAHFSSAEAITANYSTLDVNIVILDECIGNIPSPDLLAKLIDIKPNIGIISMSITDDPSWVQATVQAGGRFFLATPNGDTVTNSEQKHIRDTILNVYQQYRT
ncbi:MAG: hypothetical protein AAFV93_14895 [Chloroflexota bacterium]